MTVSPCEFPPRVLVTCVLSVISRNYNIFFVLVLSLLIKSPYKTQNFAIFVINFSLDQCFSPKKEVYYE